MIKGLLSKLISQATRDYIFREVKHTGAAIVLVVLISVAGELGDITSFEDIAWKGAAINGIRAGSTMLVLGAKRLLDALRQPSYENVEV